MSETDTHHDVHTAMITQIFDDIRDIKTEMRTMQRDTREDRKEFYAAIGGLRESINGNGKEGLAVRVDRNTSFRKSLSKLLWVLFTPVYAGMIALVIEILFRR